jgi:hypothetical protein
VADTQEPEDSDEETCEHIVEDVGITYECLASAIDTRIGYNIAIKSMLSDEEDISKRAWHDGAITELDFLRQELIGVSNYFLGYDDEDGGDDADTTKPTPRDVPLGKKPSSIPDGFRLPKKGNQ